MRPAMMLLPLAFSFLIFALLAKAAAPEPVLDITGEKVRAGVKYYILPVIRGRGGGLALAGRGQELCPLDVVQERSEVDRGIPLTFSPVNPKKGIIRVYTDVNIEFSVGATICIQSTVWKLDGFDEERKQWFVTTGGVKGNPGRDTLSNWFKIDKFEEDYKLVFCPTVCDFCKPLCRDIGIFIDENEGRRLALSDRPFKVMFKKADDDETAKLGNVM